MTIELPPFETDRDLRLCTCATLEGEFALANQKSPVIAQYETPMGDAFVRVWTETEKKPELYVECAMSSVFRKGKVPKAAHDGLESVMRIIASGLGGNASATVCATFRVRVGDLPESGLIRSLSAETKSNKIGLRMTSATLELTGAPINTLRWHIVRGKAEDQIVLIDVKAHRTITLTETYLVETWSWIYERFLLFVMGQETTIVSP